jgi:hypothetical protein
MGNKQLATELQNDKFNQEFAERYKDVYPRFLKALDKFVDSENDKQRSITNATISLDKIQYIYGR